MAGKDRTDAPETRETTPAYERVFRVRCYECDAYGHVNNANYLRYMHEAAIEASGASGHPCVSEDARACGWGVREVDIEFLRPLHYGDAVRVAVRTETLEDRRTRWEYDFRYEPSGESVARARAVSGIPAGGACDLIADGEPGLHLGPSMDDPSEGGGRSLLLPAPPPSPGVFRMRRKVLWQDLDATQRLNPAMYLVFATDSGMAVCEAHRWPLARMEAEGLGVIARRHTMVFLRDALLGDELEVATWAYGVKRSMAMRAYHILRARDEATLARVHSLYVWVGKESGHPIRIPEAFLKDFAPNFAASAPPAGRRG
jgi:acyl-CoA thioester hydrolase